MRINEFRAWVESDKVMSYKVMVGNTDENDENYTSSIIWNGHDWVHFDSGSGIHVMQYTGLRDKNGVKIFEGDIVRFKFKNETRIGFVEYVRSSFLINAGEIICDNKIRHSFSNASSKEHEIIGNIYENSDLLEVLE